MHDDNDRHTTHGHSPLSIIPSMKRLLLALFISLFTLALPVLAQEERDEPRPGEGITAFLIRHHRPGRVYYQDFLRLNEKRLRGKRELRLGVKYVIPPLREGGDADAPLPPERDRVHEPLFGPQLADVKVTSDRLRGACFYIVSGHGGPDPGAIGHAGGHELHEDEYAYDVALRLARDLIQDGADVRIIIQDEKDGIRNDRYLNNSKRETCRGKRIPLNQKERLQQRCDAINELYQADKQKYRYCRAIFLHVDSRSRGERIDVFFYHAPGSRPGERLATSMRDVFSDMYRRHQPGRGFTGTVKERGLYVLRHAAPPAILVELGNIQNAADQRRFILDTNRQALANWLLEGFARDMKADGP